MKTIKAGDVYIGDTGTLYYLLNRDLKWNLFYFDINGELMYGDDGDNVTMIRNINHGPFTYVTNLTDIQASLYRRQANET